jgi:hypothetical protein
VIMGSQVPDRVQLPDRSVRSRRSTPAPANANGSFR